LKRRPSFALLLATLALAACTGQSPNQTSTGALPPMLGGSSALPPPPGKTAGPVAVLLPLTGSMAPVGQVLANAVKLAFPNDGSGAVLDIRDTGSTPPGAAAAAQAAIAAGDGMILGPLTSAEAHAVAPVAQAANVNVLAFTNDSSAAAPGFWTLGISPTQQVQRIVQVAADNGRTQLAALLPDNDFGHSLATALSTQTSALSEPGPAITFYESGFANLNQSIKQLADFADRGQALEDKIKAAQQDNTPTGRQTLRDLQRQQIPPPAFNALFIGATDGDELSEIATFLPYYAVNPPQVQILGPALWSSLATRMADNAVLNGALFAAPDPAAAQAFVAKYTATYGAAPPAIADVAFDAAAIAKLAGTNGGYTAAVLADPSGFTGTDGVLELLPDGQVLRGLAVLQVAPGGPTVASPAPTQLAPPSS
jgi:branched-chain amino acid transport system substrate-binding protein